MSLLSIFKSHIPTAIQYVFKDGQIAVFKRRTGTDSRGHFLTEDPDQIKELNAEVAKGHPFIHIDPDESQIDSTLADPQKQLEAEMEARIRAKIMSELGDPNQARIGLKDFGSNDNAAPLGGIGNTDTLTGIAAEDNAQNANSTQSLSDKLAAIKAQAAANNAQQTTPTAPDQPAATDDTANQGK